MRQSGQASAARYLDTRAGNADNGSESAQSVADEVVKRALARRSVETGSAYQGMKAPTLHAPLRSANSADSVALVSFPPPVPPVPRRATLCALQEWEGYVVDIGEEDFIARMIDLTAGHEHESEEAIIPITVISDHDASRIVTGSIFRLVIGYERSPEGARKQVSQIVFRDLSRVTENDLRAGRDWADRMATVLSP